MFELDIRDSVLECVGVADRFARTGPDPETLVDAFGLGVSDIVAAAQRAIARKQRGRYI